MTMNYFSGIVKLDQVRPRYKDLAMQFHPDRPNGDTEIMKLINDQYHKILKSFEGTELKNNKTGETYAFRYNWQNEEDLREKIDQVIALKLDNIKLEIIGSWIWLHGSSKDQANLFNKNGIGFKFSSNHGGSWYWFRGIGKFRQKRSGLSLDQIRNVYGSETVEHERNKQLN